MEKKRALKGWTLVEGVLFMQGLQPLLKECGYHALLGGGVLNTGSSQKDLDVFLVPLNGEESRPREALGVFQSYLARDGDLDHWGDPIRDSPDYKAGEPWHWQEMLTFVYQDQRIDLFIQ